MQLRRDPKHVLAHVCWRILASGCMFYQSGGFQESNVFSCVVSSGRVLESLGDFARVYMTTELGLNDSPQKLRVGCV